MGTPMPMDVAGKAKGFFLRPSATFQATKEENLSSAFQYYVILLIIFSVLMFIVYAAALTFLPAVTGGRLPTGFGVELGIPLAFFLFVIRFYGIFLSGLTYHVFVILFGGTEGVGQTMKAVMYASTPALILGWIPVVAIVGDIWTLILIVIGIRENQELPLGRAVLVLIIPLILSLIAAMLIALTLVFHFTHLRTLMGI
jgi:hypothetical protein